MATAAVLRVLNGAHVRSVARRCFRLMASIARKLYQALACGSWLPRIKLAQRHVQAVTEADVAAVLISLQRAEDGMARAGVRRRELKCRDIDDGSLMLCVL